RDDAANPALAAATTAIGSLRRRGGGEAVVVLPPVPADLGPLATQRLERAAELTGACVLQPVETGWADAVRCLVEPLAIFGLVGVEPREIRSLLRPRAALLHASPARIRADARDVLLTCRLRPDATLRDVDEAARQALQLAAGQLAVHRIPAGVAAAERAQHVVGDRRLQPGASVRYTADRLAQLLGGGVLQEVSPGSSAHRGQECVGVVERGQYQAGR